MGISNETGCFELDSRETISSLSGQVLIAVTFTITALFALVGNVLVIVVQLFGKRSPRNMRKYLINLAISDVLLSFCVPFSFTDAVYRRWLFYHFLCPATQWLQLVTVFVTAFTLSLIGVERYIATLHPLCGLHKWLQSHCSALLVMTWLLAIAYGITPLRHTTTKEFIFKDAVYVECSMSENDWEWSIEPQLFHLANFILTYAGPVLLLSFTYSQIILKFMRIQRRKRAQQRSLEALNVMSVSSNNKQTNETAVAGNSGGKSQQQQKQQHQQQYQQPSHQQQPTVQLSRRRISAGIQLRRTPRVDNRAL
ncbi:PREDICTED: delta-type opioid receptor-like, partial [Rhagoletis zephyria]|uniref:delta-type opioid receptor-like n=1 Tax=Rhagoletis zephyria TaxID=28612 RepID=UPI0008118E8A